MKYSNCLIEALKAKLKDPKNVYIFKTPKAINKVLHFMWKKGDFYYHAPITETIHWYNRLLHKLEIKKCSKEAFDALIVRYTKNDGIKTKKCVAKVTKSEFANLPNQDWNIHFEGDDDLMLEKDYNYFKKIMKTEPLFKYRTPRSGKIRLGHLEDLKKIKSNFHWRLIGYLDKDFFYSYPIKNKDLKSWSDIN